MIKFHELKDKLIDELHNRPFPQIKIPAQVSNLVVLHPGDRENELEHITGFSRYELSRQFNKLLGTSPYRYSVNRRLDKARKLIGKMPLTELALQCGFADQAHFSRLFKTTFGMTAGKYAKLNAGTAVR